MKITVYGIPNCDQIRKSLDWFRTAGVAVHFHDYKKAGVTPALLRGWFADNDWQQFVNRAGTTWRKLPEETRAGVTDADAAIAVLVAQPSMIKRPVVTAESAGKTKLCVGYDPVKFAALTGTR